VKRDLFDNGFVLLSEPNLTRGEKMDKKQLNLKTTDIIKKLINENWVASNATGVFIIKDCILIQCFTGKNYSYRVVNYVSNEEKYLFYRRKEILEADYEGVIEKIKGLAFFNMKQASNGMDMIDVIFREVFPKYGFLVREDQVSLSKHMYENMKNQKISISDIAVGLGKTHAYLVAAIVNGIFKKRGTSKKEMPVVVTTSSIELQRSIIKDYIPEISKMLMENGILSIPIACVLRKGKENYLCENRLKDYFHTLDPKRKKADEYEGLKKLLKSSVIDLGEIKDISAYDKRKINVKSSQCMKCSKYKTCKYQLFMKQARKSNLNFQICNHNYYLADVLKRKDGRRSLLPDYEVIVIDEAHKLIDAAGQMYGTLINENQIQQLMKKMIPNQTKKKNNKDLQNKCNEIMAMNQIVFDELVNQIPPYAFTEDTEKFPTTITPRVSSLLKNLMFSIYNIRQTMNYKDRQFLIDLNHVMETLKVFVLEGNIYWLENPNAKGQRILVSIPKRINEVLGEDLWRDKQASILTSGTIAVDGKFDYIKRQLGFKQVNGWKIEELTKSSPFNFKDNCMLYMPKAIPHPNTDDSKYIQQMSQEIISLIKASSGHALVLFTSYKPLRLIYKAVKEQLPLMELIAMNRGKNTSIEEFKKSKNGVLFATGSIWEGVNIPGDILSHLIIVKLPFPIPDPVSEYEKSLYPDMHEYLDLILIPKMLIKLRQGVGRLIRSETDTGVISILDARAGVKGRYHNAVLAALPKCQLASEANDIQQFLLRKKDEAYFK